VVQNRIVGVVLASHQNCTMNEKGMEGMKECLLSSRTNAGTPKGLGGRGIVVDGSKGRMFVLPQFKSLDNPIQPNSRAAEGQRSS
jgi:hypothetical protein